SLISWIEAQHRAVHLERAIHETLPQIELGQGVGLQGIRFLVSTEALRRRGPPRGSRRRRYGSDNLWRSRRGRNDVLGMVIERRLGLAREGQWCAGTWR